jgi:hypothetical protein
MAGIAPLLSEEALSETKPRSFAHGEQKNVTPSSWIAARASSGDSLSPQPAQ